MKLRTFTLTLALALAVVPGMAFQQTPSFEVASIHPAAPLDLAGIQAGKLPRLGMNVTAGRVEIGFLSLKDLVVAAYRMKPYQVSGPDWIAGQRFDITATLPQGATEAQVPDMLQVLLAERFKLVMKRESRELPVYELVVDKEGHKLSPAVPEPQAPAELAKGEQVLSAGNTQLRITPGAGGGAGGASVTLTNKETGPVRMMFGADGAMKMQMDSATLANVCDFLTTLVDRPVVDKTGLQGKYQLALQLSMAEMMNAARAAGANAGIPLPPIGGPGVAGPGGGLPGASIPDPGGASVFQAVEKLGLKLEGRRAPVDTLVVVSAERTPTEN